MRRPPLLATAIVALAVVAMIGLGVWQLRRATWKEALLARYTAARTMPPVAFRPLAADDDSLLFRRSSAFCREPIRWRTAPGRSRAGAPGWRWIATCHAGGGGPEVTLDMGWSADWRGRIAWRGGRVAGMISTQPDHRSLIGRALGHAAPVGLMLIAERPAPGLQPSAYPSIADIPNNHRGYAVQWFLFALSAVVIYILALRWKRRGAG